MSHLWFQFSGAQSSNLGVGLSPKSVTAAETKEQSHFLLDPHFLFFLDLDMNQWLSFHYHHSSSVSVNGVEATFTTIPN